MQAMQEKEVIIDFYVSGTVRVFDIPVHYNTDKFKNPIRDIWMGYIAPTDNKWVWRIYDYKNFVDSGKAISPVQDFYSLKDYENYEEMIFQYSLVHQESINFYLVLAIQEYVNVNYDSFVETESRKVLLKY